MQEAINSVLAHQSCEITLRNRPVGFLERFIEVLAQIHAANGSGESLSIRNDGVSPTSFIASSAAIIPNKAVRVFWCVAAVKR